MTMLLRFSLPLLFFSFIVQSLFFYSWSYSTSFSLHYSIFSMSSVGSFSPCPSPPQVWILAPAILGESHQSPFFRCSRSVALVKVSITSAQFADPFALLHKCRAFQLSSEKSLIRSHCSDDGSTNVAAKRSSQDIVMGPLAFYLHQVCRIQL